MRNLRVALAILCLTGLGNPSVAEISWSLGGASDLIASARVAQVALGSDRPENLIQLLHRVEINIGEDVVIERIALAYYYPTAEAVQQFGSDSVSWDHKRENLRFLEVATVLPDGTRIDFNPDSANVNDTDSYNTFSDTKSVVLHPPGLVAGAMNVLVYEREMPAERPYHYSVPIQSSVEKRAFNLEVSWAAKAPAWEFPEKLLNCDNSGKRLTCSALDLPKVGFDDTDHVLDVMPEFIVATSVSWDHVVETMLENIARASRMTGVGYERALNEIKESDSPLAAAFELVSRGIRYASFSTGAHTHLPHGLEETLHNRFGDCKDKSTLLLAFLKALGYDAYAALVATDRTVPGKLGIASLGYFNHIVVCVQDKQGEFCLDPTDIYTDSGTTSDWIQGKVRLKLLPDARPDTVPASMYRWRADFISNLVFLSNGGQTEDLTRRYFGEYAAWSRSELSGLDSKERLSWLSQEYSDTVATPIRQDFRVDRLHFLEAVVEIGSTSEFAPMLDVTEPLNYTDYASWIRSFARSLYADNRYRGFEFEGVRLSSEYHFDFDGHWAQPELGPEVELVSNYGSIRRDWDFLEGKVVVKTLLNMPKQYINLEQVGEFNRFLDLVIQETMIRIWAKPIGGGGSSETGASSAAE
ncbi:DUF3857 domain-containing protein [Parahaliea mediterranea]|uniref:DUF3857 domain-containing protein n=1 Tax=Parahaliea mediterranea TaxID=651086 RepID=A0A939DF05_9GAMM|nr:DUF3857 domain-containing protein [Parahaliea mediterranea]MBN7796854.1 DUF3857 domain-containing protein [Parahaliea mediterranea]